MSSDPLSMSASAILHKSSENILDRCKWDEEDTRIMRSPPSLFCPKSDSLPIRVLQSSARRRGRYVVIALREPDQRPCLQPPHHPVWDRRAHGTAAYRREYQQS